MKEFLFNLGSLIYGIFSASILILSVVLPFAFAFEDHPPFWLAWIVYPLALIIMASQSQVIKYLENYGKDYNRKKL